MPSLLRIIGLSCVTGMLVVSAALAQPDPATSVLGINFPVASNLRNYIQIGGATSGTPDNCADTRCMNYTVLVNDADGVPVVGSVVVVDFSACTPAAGGDTQLSCDQLFAVTGQTYIAPSMVSGTTDAAGMFTFRIQGASNSTTMTLPGPFVSDGIAISEPSCASVSADGVALGSLFPVHYDINGLGSPVAAVNAADVATTMAEVVRAPLVGTWYRRTDLNMNCPRFAAGGGCINAADVAVALRMANDQALGTGSRNTGGPGYCP